MLRINDKVYLHIGDLSKGLSKVGYNKDRLCVVKEVKNVVLDNGEEAGIFILKALNCDKEYRVLAEDKIWKIATLEELIEGVKQSNYDAQMKEQLINDIFNN